jgi:hypothetical protein
VTAVSKWVDNPLEFSNNSNNEKSIHKTMIRQLPKSTLENMTCVKHSREHDLWKASNEILIT